jgi:hypothetical protein
MSRVIGYAFDAALHCEYCSYSRFGCLLDTGCARDADGNEPHPVFSTDETNEEGEPEVCEDCLSELE